MERYGPGQGGIVPSRVIVVPCTERGPPRRYPCFGRSISAVPHAQLPERRASVSSLCALPVVLQDGPGELSKMRITSVSILENSTR